MGIPPNPSFSLISSALFNYTQINIRSSSSSSPFYHPTAILPLLAPNQARHSLFDQIPSSQTDGIRDEPVLVLLDFPDHGGLFLCGTVVVDDPETSVKGDGDGHPAQMKQEIREEVFPRSASENEISETRDGDREGRSCTH
jgi:hypothetical protein